MPQRAMVRIWVASLHQKSSSVFSTLELFVLLVREAHKCGWIRTAAATSLKTAQKQPSGLFLAARLAQSTRAHQKSFSVTTTLELFVLYVRENSRMRADSNSCGAVAEDSAKTAQWAVFSSAARAIHPRPPKNRNVSQYAAVLFYSSIFTSPACQSSCARILFCTISPAGVRAMMRPSKVAYPARTQFCTKASCAVENCLPYRAL